MILPQVLWSLYVYEVTLSIVETLERKISTYPCRWLGLPHSLSSAALYGRGKKLHLPISSLDEDFRVSRTREAILYGDFMDPSVASDCIIVKTDRMWRAQEALERAES